MYYVANYKINFDPKTKGCLCQKSSDHDQNSYLVIHAFSWKEENMRARTDPYHHPYGPPFLPMYRCWYDDSK